MIKLLTLITLLLPTPGLSAEVGVMQGTHIGMKGLNDTHPYISAEGDSLGAVWYLNSYNKGAVGIYKHFTGDNFKLLCGATTGYKQTMSYNGKEYNLPKSAFITPGIMLMVIPSYRFDRYEISLVGNSINFGINFSF